MSTFRILIAIIAALAAAGLGQLQAEELTLRSSVEVCGKEILLSDIVEEEIAGCDDIFIALSPGWFSQKRVRKNFVLNLVKGRDIELTGAEEVLITRDMTNRSEGIRTRIEKIVSARLSDSRWKEKCKSLSFNLVDFPENIEIPSGEYTVECKLPRQLHGPRNISFTVRGRGGFKRRYSARAEFVMKIDCAVAQRSIRKGERISSGDIAWVEKNLAECYREPASKNGGVLGLQASRLIAEGEILSADALERIPLIMEGDDVEIILNRGPLRVKVTGRSLEDGYIGERILIRNGANGKIEKYCVFGRGKVSPERMEVGSR